MRMPRTHSKTHIKIKYVILIRKKETHMTTTIVDDDEEFDEEFEEKDFDECCEQCLGHYSSKSKYACQNDHGLNFCCENCEEQYEDDSDEEDDTPFN